MIKTAILIIGIALVVLGGQDLIRITLNPEDLGIWGGVTDEYFARIMLDVVLVFAGIIDTVYARRITISQNK